MYVFLFRSLIGHLDLKNTKAAQDQIRLQLLAQELAVVATKSNYVSILCQAFEGAPLTDDFCSNLARLLKLNFAQHVAFGLALSQSVDPAVQQQGSSGCLFLLRWCQIFEPNIVAGFKVLKLKVSEFNLSNMQTLSDRILSSMLYVLRTSPAFTKERDSIVRGLQGLYVEGSFDVILLPLLQPEAREADIVKISDDSEPSVDLDEFATESQVLLLVCSASHPCAFSFLFGDALKCALV